MALMTRGLVAGVLAIDKAMRHETATGKRRLEMVQTQATTFRGQEEPTQGKEQARDLCRSFRQVA